jgi:hypothetical protein
MANRSKSKRRRDLDPDTLLVRCDTWPTIFSLTPPAQQLLVRLSQKSHNRKTGVAPARAWLISALILDYDEPDPDAIADCCVDLRGKRWRGEDMAEDPFGTRRRLRQFLWLPAPVTLRLDRLVARGLESQREVQRTNLVVGLMQHANRQSNRHLHEICDAARRRTAGSCTLAGEDPQTVLTWRRPKPGRRVAEVR